VASAIPVLWIVNRRQFEQEASEMTLRQL